MATREMALCLVLSGLTATATAQTASAPETWTPISRMAQTITGRVTFTPSEITFQNGKSLSLIRGGQMLFRPVAKQKKVMADLYRVSSPDDPVLENGNNTKACGCRLKGLPRRGAGIITMANSRMLAMRSAVALRTDFTGPELRQLARYTRDANQARRLLALAVIYDGGGRSEAPASAVSVCR